MRRFRRLLVSFKSFLAEDRALLHSYRSVPASETKSLSLNETGCHSEAYAGRHNGVDSILCWTLTVWFSFILAVS